MSVLLDDFKKTKRSLKQIYEEISDSFDSIDKETNIGKELKDFSSNRLISLKMY